MADYLLAHDIGTSGNKASLFTITGSLAESITVPYNTSYSCHVRAEQNADDWWNAVCLATRRLIEKVAITPDDICAVSFSGQMMGCLCVDKNGTPLRPAIIWADQRAQVMAEKIEKEIPQKDYYRIVGHRNTASYGIQKLMWIRENEPGIFKNTYKMLNAKDYVVFRLTGNFYTDYSDANGCGFFDLKYLCWSRELLSCAGIPMGLLPDPMPSTYVAGTVTPAAAGETGLKAGTPVILGSGDGVATNVGAGSISPGKTFLSLGTSAWITTTSELPLYDPQMRTVTWAHMIPGLYAPNGTMQYAGGSFEWMKKTICTEEIMKATAQGSSPYDLIHTEAGTSSPGCGGVLFLPYLLGERAPRWDPYASGTWTGIRPETTRGDLIRSVLEGISLNLEIILRILRTQMDITEITLMGGGAKSVLWRQILSDILQCHLLVPSFLDEAASMGAAVCAGVGAGLFDDFTSINRFLKISKIQEPDPKMAEVYAPVKERFEECYQALKGFFIK